MIDLRSDTVTQPTDAMRAVIASAPVGDDVYHDDPSVKELEAKVATLLGKDDAIYMPTGTMSNQVALRAHTQPGDVVLASKAAHIDSHELGAANALAGLTVQQLPSVRGVFTADQVRLAIPQPISSMPAHLFQPVTLVACENTHNDAGGVAWPLEQLRQVCAAAHHAGAATHLDGARLWNAVAATGIDEGEIAQTFDTVSVCFSKGLGAPVGSALVGRQDLIDRSRRFKQMYGGGLRQSGIVAVAASYALENHRDRLHEDHQNAARLAAGLAEIPNIKIDLDMVETNIVYCEVTSISAVELCDRLLDAGVAILPMDASRIRAVTHLGVTSSDIDRALTAIANEISNNLI